jgi:hypothetical protein
MTIETLNTDGFLFTEIAVEFNVLKAEFGDGYEVAALVGSSAGTRTWALKIDVLPGEWNVGAPAVEGKMRAAYLWQFFRASKAAEDAPFWIELEDPAASVRRQYLASFTDQRLSYDVLCAKIYATGITLRERRVLGVTSPIAVALQARGGARP